MHIKILSSVPVPALAIIGIFLGVLTSSKAIIIPPFNTFGFPSIGADSSPGFLLVWDGASWGFIIDPSKGPYDGADDVYVGVFNASASSTVFSVVVSSSANAQGGIYNFDGDGIGQSPYNVLGAIGYAGPKVTFSNIAANHMSGTVNFTGGLAPGETRFFSLEEGLQNVIPPLVVTPTPTPDGGATLLLLGISVGFLGFLRRRLVS